MSETDGNVRYTIDISAEGRIELSALAKRYKLTQGEVIEVLLAVTRDSNELETPLRAKRDAKVAARQAATKLRRLSPEKLAALLAQIEE